jgi:hypothetical protein
VHTEHSVATRGELSVARRACRDQLIPSSLFIESSSAGVKGY